MSRYAATILLVMATLVLGAQHRRSGIEAGFGVAVHRMDDMKYLQEYLLTLYPVKGRVIASFPAYTSGSVGLVRQLYPTVKVGAGYAYSATGGRNNYTDYTGSITTDMQAESHRIGARIVYSLAGNERYDLSVFGQADAAFTRLSITSSLYVMGVSETAISRYRSVSPNITGGVEAYLHFTRFSIGLSGGYLADVPGDLTDKDRNAPLDDPLDGSRNLTADWTGWRAGLRAIAWFGP